MSDESKFIADQLNRILDKQGEQVERLVRIETNHNNLNSMLTTVNETLKEISETDQEQSERIEAVSVKTDSIEETLREMKLDQRKMDERIHDLELRLSIEEETEKGASARYKFWADITKSPWFKWVLLAAGIFAVALITGKTEWMIDIIQKVI